MPADIQPEYSTGAEQPIAQWSWRPGIAPRNAIAIGGVLIFLALVFTSSGLFALVEGILDSNAAPSRVPGQVTGYTSNILDNLPHLVIRLHMAGFPAQVTPAISPALRDSLQPGEQVILDFSPRLHTLYALESKGQRYNLPGSSPAGNPLGAIALIVLGLLLLPYPFFLTRWGWRDIREGSQNIDGTIIALNTSAHLRKRTPGLTSRLMRAWYMVDVQPIRGGAEMRFRVNETRYMALFVGEKVRLEYSPHLRYVYSIKQLEEVDEE